MKIKEITPKNKIWNNNVFKNIPKEEIPSKLYYIGDISLLFNIENNIAVIGSRRISKDIADREKTLVRYITSKGFTVISGLALGCDTIAHDETIRNKGKTIAIVSTKLDYIYPKQNRKLAENIVKSGGLIISEYNDFTSNDDDFKKRLVRRDRLQAMFANTIIACAGKSKSGTRHAINKSILYKRKTLFMYNEDTDKNDTHFELAKDFIGNDKAKVATKKEIGD